MHGVSSVIADTHLTYSDIKWNYAVQFSIRDFLYSATLCLFFIILLPLRKKKRMHFVFCTLKPTSSSLDMKSSMRVRAGIETRKGKISTDNALVEQHATASHHYITKMSSIRNMLALLVLLIMLLSTTSLRKACCILYISKRTPVVRHIIASLFDCSVRWKCSLCWSS